MRGWRNQLTNLATEVPGTDCRAGEGKDHQTRDSLGMIHSVLTVGQACQHPVVVDLQVEQHPLPPVPVEGNKEPQMDKYQEAIHQMH